LEPTQSICRLLCFFGTHAGDDTVNLTDGHFSFKASGGVIGTFVVQYGDGFHGHAVANITRYFTPYKPVVSGSTVQIRLLGSSTLINIQVQNIQAGGGTLVMVSQEGYNRYETGPDINFSAGSEFRQHLDRVELRPCFTGAVQYDTLNMDYGINFAHTVYSNLIQSIPAFRPAQGVPYVAAVEIEKWRFGIYVINVISAIPPN
jgi:hypothetical protein